MQTFLPYPSFRDSARVLDYRRLGKQRVEAKQILLALANGGAWANHPATKMWRGYHFALAAYGVSICEEWIARGYNDSLLSFFYDNGHASDEPCTLPPWLGTPAFHASHRSNLLRKDPEFYGKYGWTESPDLPYIWPEPAHA